jgi:hypothetical protein
MNHKFAMIFCILIAHKALAMDINQDSDDPSSNESPWNLVPLNDINDNQSFPQFLANEDPLQPSSDFWNNLDHIFAADLQDPIRIANMPVPVSSQPFPPALAQIPLATSNQPPNRNLLVTNKVTTNNASSADNKDQYPKKCPVCAASLNQYNVTHHMRSHTTITQNQEGVSIFTCNQCNKSLKDKYYLYEHMARCTSYPVCSLCKLHIFRSSMPHVCKDQSAHPNNDN